MRRKSLVITLAVLVAVLFMVNIVPVAGVTNTDITIEHFETHPQKDITEDTEFTFNVWLKNNSGKDLSNIFMIVDQSSSFYVHTGRTMIPVVELVADGMDYFCTTPLVYKGTGSEFRFTIKYTKDGTDFESYQTVYLNTKETKPTEPSQPADTSRYIPKLSVPSDVEIPEVSAGTDNDLILPIKNNGIYAARDITVALDFWNNSNNYFTLNAVRHSKDIKEILPNKTEEVVFNLNVRADTPKGLYMLKINYSYHNVFNDAFNTTETIYIRIVNDKTAPDILIHSIATNPDQIVPGELVDLNVKLVNMGTSDAKNVKITLLGLDSKGLNNFNASNVNLLGNILGYGTSTMYYSLFASSELQGSSYPISVKLDYEDVAGNKYTREYDSFIKIQSKVEDEVEGEATVEVKDILVSSNQIKPGNQFNINFTLKNTGDGDASNIKVWLDGPSGIITKSVSPIRIQTIDAFGERGHSFNMMSSKSITGSQPIAINVEYDVVKSGQTIKYSITQYLEAIFADVEDDTRKTVPRIIIDTYSFSPEVVEAGKVFSLDVSFHNTNKEIAVENIKVTVTSKDGTFTPENSGSTFYIEGINTQNSIKRSIELYPKSDAAPKSYSLDFFIEYEDKDGNQYTATETLNIPVKQFPRLQTGQFSLPPDGFIGQGMFLFTDFFNMGKSTLYNLMVKLEGDFSSDNSTYFVGNFEPGRSDYFEGMFVPNNEGMLNGALVFYFEDESGREQKIEKEFTLNIHQQMKFEYPNEGDWGEKEPFRPGNNETKGISFYAKVGIGAAGVLLLAGIVIAIKKRRSFKEGMTFDE